MTRANGFSQTSGKYQNLPILARCFTWNTAWTEDFSSKNLVSRGTLEQKCVLKKIDTSDLHAHAHVQETATRLGTQQRSTWNTYLNHRVEFFEPSILRAKRPEKCLRCKERESVDASGHGKRHCTTESVPDSQVP